MKYTDNKTFDYDGIKITAKEVLIHGKPEERYFIYESGFNNWAGLGWYDIGKMMKEYREWKAGFRGAKSRVELWKESEEGQYLKKHCLRQYYETLQEIEGRK